MIKISDIINLIKKLEKFKTWYHHDRETKWYAVGFAVALWFYLLSENYAQVGYSWQRCGIIQQLFLLPPPSKPYQEIPYRCYP